MEIKNITAKLIRIITVAPLMALFLLTSLFFSLPEEFGGIKFYIISVICLTVLPLLAYPLQTIIPYFKTKGREGQRNLAIIMAVLGYICSIICAAIFEAPKMAWVIYLLYLLSGIGIMFFNKVLKVRASGHACGVIGPALIASFYFGKKIFAVAVFLTALVFWSSLTMKRHTKSQLFWGSIIPLGMFGLTFLITNVFIF